MSEDDSLRCLAGSTGVSKSEVPNALKRCTDVGLLKTDRYTGCPVVNRAGLYDLLALTDALRVGKPREQAVAAWMLAVRMVVDVKPA